MVVDAPDFRNKSRYFPSDSWMTQRWPQLQARLMSNITLPGTHDSGMSEANGSIETGPLLRPVTKTQSLTIYEQIVNAGARYLDMRPVYYRHSLLKSDIPSGYYLAHYSNIGDSPAWVGLIGRSLRDVCDDVRRAMAEIGEHEIVLVELSHAKYLIEGGTADTLEPERQRQVVGEILAALDGHLYRGAASTNFYTLQARAIAGVRATAFVWDSNGSLSQSGYGPADGLFTANNLPYYNSWYDVDTNEVGTFLANMENSFRNHPYPKDPPFLMAWHLTAEAPWVGQSLRDFAAHLNPLLGPSLAGWREVMKANWPRIVAWDFIEADPSLLAHVIALNGV
jgi:hypothetical protein